MPLPIPNLDDRRFDDLRKELISRIPTLTDSWTDFNISDPGIMLIELLCHLGEMVMYRLNRITERSRNNFLKLILEPATPVTVDVTFTMLTPPSLLSPPLVEVIIPKGTVVAAPSVNGKEFLFETIEEATISAALLSPPETISTTVLTRSLCVVRDESLGKSNGKPNQMFSLAETPVLLDAKHVSDPEYNPNPVLKVGTKEDDEAEWEYWEFRMDLLDSLASDKHFTVDSFTGNVRFGDGSHGKIPPKGAAIVCQRYRKVLAYEARVLAGEISELRSEIPGIPRSEVLVFNETDAVGGTGVFAISEGLSKGLELFKETFRATTVPDYENLVKEVFNREYAFRPGQERVKRVKCLPQANQDTIHLMIIPDPMTQDYLPSTVGSPPEDFIEYPKPSEDLLQRIHAFLEKRRLITVRLFVEGPIYQEVQIEVALVRKQNTDKDKVKEATINGIRAYLDPIGGGQDKAGWPFGRALYKSELYQIIEGIEGVEYVEDITLSGTGTQIEIGERSLIKISMLNVTTKP